MAIDPCAEAERLRAIRTAIITGKSESLIRFDVEEVRFHKADMAALNAEIARLESACDLVNGVVPTRRRFASRAYFRRG